MIMNSQVTSQQQVDDINNIIKTRQLQTTTTTTDTSDLSAQTTTTSTGNAQLALFNKDASNGSSISQDNASATNKRSEPKLSVVLPASQKTLVTPTIITTSDIGGPPITPTSQLFSSLAQLNGQDAVGLFTGLPSCTPTSADSLAATSSLNGINPFFWGVSAFTYGANHQHTGSATSEGAGGGGAGGLGANHTHTAYQNDTLGSSTERPTGFIAANSGPTNNEKINEETMSNKQKTDRCQLSKLSFDQLQAANAILSPLNFFLSPERLRFGLQNQHPLQVNACVRGSSQNGSLPDYVAVNQANNFARSPIEEYHHNQQQVRQEQLRYAAQEITNQVAAHQQNNSNITVAQSASSSSNSSMPSSSMFTIPVSVTTNGTLSAHCQPTQNTYSHHQRASHNGDNHNSCASNVGSTVEQTAHQHHNHHCKQLISSSPHPNMSTYQLIAAQQGHHLQVARNGIINQAIPGQLVYHYTTSTTTPPPSTNPSSVSLNQNPTNTYPKSNQLVVQSRQIQTQQHQQQQQQQQVDDLTETATTTVCSTSSHEFSAQQLEPPAAHHNRNQYHNQLQSSHPTPLLVINNNNNNNNNGPNLHLDPRLSAELSQTRQQVAVHYDSNGQPVGLYNPHLRQLYLTQNHQNNYNIQQQQPPDYHEVALKSTPIQPNHQYIPYQQHSTTNRTSAIVAGAALKSHNEQDSQKTGEISQPSKESISSSNSLSCSLSQSPNRFGDQSSGNNSSARSSVNPDIDVTATTVPLSRQNSKFLAQTEAQNTSAKKHLNKSKKQTVIQDKEPDSSNGQAVIKKKSKGGRKKKQVTSEELVARKNRSKERNRVAAKRCRQKRKQFLDELCGRIENLNELSKKLQKENTMLKNELELWKQRHKSCNV